MSSSDLKPVIHYFHSRLMDTAVLHTHIEKLIAPALGSDLAPLCHVIRFSDGQLELAVDNTAVAAKIRNLAPTLQETLLTHNILLTVVRVKVLPQTLTEEEDPTEDSHPVSNPIKDKVLADLLKTLKNGKVKHALTKIVNAKP